MFIAVVAIFGICWLPYHMFFLYAYHNPYITSSNNVPHLFLGFYWLAMSNTMVNPIIYYWMNRKFRHYFQEVMCFCCFQLWNAKTTNKTHNNMYMQPNSMSMERKSKSCKCTIYNIKNRWKMYVCFIYDYKQLVYQAPTQLKSLNYSLY